RDVPARRLLALADDLLDLLTDALQGDPEGLQGLRGHALPLVDEAKEDVLGADVVVVEHPGLFLGQDDNTPCSVGEPLEHSHSLPAAPCWCTHALSYGALPHDALLHSTGRHESGPRTPGPSMVSARTG